MDGDTLGTEVSATDVAGDGHDDDGTCHWWQIEANTSHEWQTVVAIPSISWQVSPGNHLPSNYLEPLPLLPVHSTVVCQTPDSGPSVAIHWFLRNGQ